MNSPDQERTLVRAASVEPLGHGRFSAELSPHYTVVGHPHGGYLQCVMASAALASASSEGATHRDVTSMSTNFVRAPELGTVELRADVRRLGRNLSFVHVELYQDNVLAIESIATLGTLVENAPVRYQDAVLPEVAPPEKCVRSSDDEKNIFRVVDQLLDPTCTGWVNGEISARGELLGWLRMNDGDTSWNPWSLHFASDSFPPASFPLGSTGWVPTLQFTSRVLRVPQGEWLRVRQWAIVVVDGLLEERCELFDASDALVASSSQIALVRFPDGQ